MKTVQSLLPVFGLIAAATAFDRRWANETTAYTTEVVTSYTTFCPEATTFTQGTKTYTATASETVTITDCPCTIKKPKPTSPPVGPTSPANATIPIVWTTATLTAYTTYCPEPTTVVHGNKTYTATTATTLTITNCPCTVSYPATTSTTITLSYLTTYCPAPTTITYSSSTYPVSTPGTVTIPIVTVTPIPASPPTPSAPAPTTVATVAPIGTPIAPSATTTGPVQVTAAAGRTEAGFGALAVAGLAAMLL
ncbi:putative clock-controlled protein 6 [Halenospora varia]|nr:putative clock-controlled protein 6 [Halenospora varia]